MGRGDSGKGSRTRRAMTGALLEACHHSSKAACPPVRII